MIAHAFVSELKKPHHNLCLCRMPQTDDMKVKVVSQDDWQRCRITLDAAAVQAQGTPMQEHIQALSDMLPLLHSQQFPTQSERRGMAKKLGMVQKIGGNMVGAQSLMGN